MKTPIERKMVFGISPATATEPPLVLLGIPAGAWDYMKDGHTHTFDLTRAGVPVKLVLYGAADHSAAIKMIEDHMANQNLPILDQRREDFSIKNKEV